MPVPVERPGDAHLRPGHERFGPVRSGGSDEVSTADRARGAPEQSPSLVPSLTLPKGGGAVRGGRGGGLLATTPRCRMTESTVRS